MQHTRQVEVTHRIYQQGLTIYHTYQKKKTPKTPRKNYIKSKSTIKRNGHPVFSLYFLDLFRSIL